MSGLVDFSCDGQPVKIIDYSPEFPGWLTKLVQTQSWRAERATIGFFWQSRA